MLLPSYRITIMHKWHTVGLKEGYLFKPKAFIVLCMPWPVKVPTLVTICSIPIISQTGKLSPRDIKWHAQEHTAYWGRAQIQTQAGLLMGVLCSPRHIGHKMLLVSILPWDSQVDLACQQLSCLIPWFPFSLFYFGSLQWWWCHSSVPSFQTP